MSSRTFLSVVDRWRNPKGWRLWFALFALAVLLVAVAQLTYSTGGTRNAYLHAAYVPVALAGALFRAPGGLIAGLVAGVLHGPFMPLNVGEGTFQTAGAWLYRLGFFMLLGGFTGQLSYVLNLRLDQLHQSNENLSQTYAHTLKAFTSLVAYRDEQTAGHCDRVANNARVVGERLGLSQSDINNLYWAGILHDLGKVATPTDVLLKPGPLSEVEFQEIKKHPTIGADLLLDVTPEFAPIAEGIRSHHERWNGEGYPDGRQGGEIPLFGRILAVVDVFEALTSKRPYRGPVEPGEALAYLRNQAGQHFDPQLVQVFLEAKAEGCIFMSGQESPFPEQDCPLPELPAAAPNSQPN